MSAEATYVASNKKYAIKPNIAYLEWFKYVSQNSVLHEIFKDFENRLF